MKKRILNLTLFTVFVLIQAGHLGNSPVRPIDPGKLNPSLQTLLVQHGVQISGAPAFGIPVRSYRDQQGQQRYGVLIKTNDVTQVQNSGIHLNAVFGSYATAKVTTDELLLLASRQEVSYVDIPTISLPVMNNSLPEIGARLLHSGFVNNTPYKGAGAIILVYDSGIDWKHPAFRDPDDTTKSRILCIWDQTLTPTGGESNPSDFNYGVEYSKAQIENELDGTPANFVRTTNPDGHGTHVASIAGGTGTKFSGVAPEAEYIIVKGGDGSFAEDDIINGLSYAESKSALYAKPIVVNLSLGGQTGPHDGTRAYETAIDDFNSKAGQVAVVAAGNDGAELIHISGILQTGGSTTFQFSVPAGYTPTSGSGNDEFAFSLWYDENTTVTAKVTSPNGVNYSVNNNQAGSPVSQSDGFIYIENTRVDDSKQNIYLFVSDQNPNNPPASGTWKLDITNASGTATYDGWLAQRDVGDAVVSLLNGNALKTVAMPGTADKAITVGAYVTKTSWPASDGKQYQYSDDDLVGEIAYFSSVGPTRDGRMKPDITAPGKGITAALSRYDQAPVEAINPDTIYVLSQGTSMATPHVAGAAAIMLGLDATLTATQVRDLLSSTANSDAYTGSLPNNTWGHGKLNILNAVIKKLNYADGSTRDMMAYGNNNAGPYYEFGVSDSMAVRFMAAQSGEVTGLFLDLLISHPDINPVISGTGFLFCSIYADEGGIPGNQIGSTVAMPLTDLDPGTRNFINMHGAGVNVTGGSYYHAVIGLSDPGAYIKILFDDGTTDQINNPSLLFFRNSWYTFKSAFSGTPYNLLLEVQTTTLINPTAIDEHQEDLASGFELYPNYPNPFNPSTTIRYSIGQPGKVSLTIYDILGRKVVTLLDSYQSGGLHEITWEAANQIGDRVPSGIYFCHLKTPEGIRTRKMILLK